MKTILELKNIEKTYQQGSYHYQALKSVNLCIESSELVGLCGPSGSGKSTLLNICGLLDEHYQGHYQFNNQVISNNPKIAQKLRRKHFGYVFQNFNLVPVMTAFENVEYPLLLNKELYPNKQERRQQVEQILEQVGLQDFISHRPGRLSGGQQQRVAIARALVHKPQLVLADEPTASLDSHTAHQIIELMQDLGQQQGCSFLIASHDQRMTQHCHRLIQLRDGEIHQEVA